jgi:hypothetical protein
MRIYHLQIIVLLFVSSCRDNSVTFGDVAEIWPMHPGDVHYYQITSPTWAQDTLKFEITGSLKIMYNSQQYTVTKMASYSIHDLKPPYQFLYWNGPDGVYVMGGIAPTDTIIVKELMLKYPARVGDTWNMYPINYSYSSGKFNLGTKPQVWSLVSQNISVQTPSGIFNCYQYRFSQHPDDDILDIWDYNYYYAPGLGQISEKTVSTMEKTTKEEYILINR